jgi:hypothetical protein
MNTKQDNEDFPEVQAAIYRVSLSLDSFLLNGIPYGAIHGDVFNGFLEKTATNLLTELATLDQQAPHAPVADQPKVREILAALRVKCQEVIDLVTGLRSFRNVPRQQWCADVSRIPLLRGECVRLIQEVERCFRTPKPFYSSLPGHSTAAVNAFLTNLERMFTDEQTAERNRRE